MSVAATRVTVGTTAVQLAGEAADFSGPGSYIITNRGTAAVFIGADNTVTTANGYELTNATSLAAPVRLGSGDELWAIAGTAGHRVDVLAVRD